MTEVERLAPGTSGASIRITGVVQGVGFRPFVYALATRLGLAGWVRNTSAGVEVEVDGAAEALAAFVAGLRDQAPPLARIESLRVEPRGSNGYTGFAIVASRAAGSGLQPVTPDVGICPDCLRELFDPHDRRYRYPFINCTNCGPRFTIIQSVPYDRPNTTMASFELCPDCAAEYGDPRDRRFHAQPVACPACGPRLWLEVDGRRPAEGEAALQAARRLLAEGKIVAVKGLGGFHLACDAGNEAAVGELRRRKLRVDKPFAVMLPDMQAVEAQCLIQADEAGLLQSPQRPIVVLARRPGSSIAAEVAPAQATLGVLLPYTPLHCLLLERGGGAGRDDTFPQALVMTSGNRSEEPIASRNDQAREQLAGLADAYLMHDRDICTRCDDSVVRVVAGQTYPLRRSRGYAPAPLRLPWEAPPLLATGAELKNTFCLTQGRFAFLSHHIGDLENFETLSAFEEGVALFERLFHAAPQALAYDRHPDYLAARYALERARREGLPAVAVQHHHAHVAACMADAGMPGDARVIGVALDGTGYGDDETIWGGEFLLANYAGYERALHLSPIRMPGGEAAVREPWRLALAWLDRAGIGWDDDLPPVQASSPEARRVIRQMLGESDAARRLNAPLTSSMGRLFDALASLVGVRHTVNYEAQAAIELEARLTPDETGAYEFAVGSQMIDPVPAIRAVVSDLRAHVPKEVIAARVHNGLAEMVGQACRELRRRRGLEVVALSGGVWQNVALLHRAVNRLRGDGFTVCLHRQVPANDGGLALGQAAVAAWHLTHPGTPGAAPGR